MDRKRRINQFDQLVDKLTAEFSKIPNFESIHSDALATQLYNAVIYRIAEISSYKNLVANHFVPAANKAIHEGIQSFRTSKYKHLIRIDEQELRETLYDTLRFAYVGVFHKFESFVDDLVFAIDTFMHDDLKPELPLEKYIKEKFDFNIRYWNQFYILQKINWIGNCTKHKDGFPLKEPIPLGFMYAPKDRRIQLTVDEFKQDCDALLKFCPIYFRLLFMFSQYQVFFENKDTDGFSEEYKAAIDTNKAIIRGQMITLISNLKMGLS